MRWKVRSKEEPELGETRLIRKFLLFPKRINDEWRWLERALIYQKYISRRALIPEVRHPIYIKCWRDSSWADNESRIFSK